MPWQHAARPSNPPAALLRSGQARIIRTTLRSASNCSPASEVLAFCNTERAPLKRNPSAGSGRTHDPFGATA
eukprot:300741-Alexandrium_andersonii.AAC.1